MADVVLVDVDEGVLAEIVRLAQLDAADEVTAPVTPGPEWTPERVAWLRALHRECRAGLDGPRRQRMWAITVGGRVAGFTRLARTDEDGVFETGIWVAGAFRRAGVARAAVAAVLTEGAAAGGRAVVADTTAGNTGARGVLAGLGFDCAAPDAAGKVTARFELPRPQPT